MADKLKQFDAGEVFSGKKSGTKITGFAAPSPYMPNVDDDFIFCDLGKHRSALIQDIDELPAVLSTMLLSAIKLAA